MIGIGLGCLTSLFDSIHSTEKELLNAENKEGEMNDRDLQPSWIARIRLLPIRVH